MFQKFQTDGRARIQYIHGLIGRILDDPDQPPRQLPEYPPFATEPHLRLLQIIQPRGVERSREENIQDHLGTTHSFAYLFYINLKSGSIIALYSVKIRNGYVQFKNTVADYCCSDISHNAVQYRILRYSVFESVRTHLIIYEVYVS